MVDTNNSSSLRDYLNLLESTGNLVHFNEELSTRFEIPAAIKYIARHKRKTVVFEHVQDYDIPVVGNLFASRQHLAVALGVREEQLEQEIISRVEKPVQPKIVDSAPVQEVVIRENIDIQKIIPVLTHHEKDAGPYFTSAVAIAKDPETGIRGMGVHRIQIKGKDKIAILLASPPLSNFLSKAEQSGKFLEIAIALGVDPLTFLGSVFFAPEGIDKFDIAGGLQQAPVELVKCLSLDLEVPSNAEFILEGHIIPGKREVDGPFGETTGYYMTFDSPTGKITSITHRSKPLYYGLVPFIGEEEVIFQAISRPRLLDSCRESLPDILIKDLNIAITGAICLVQIHKRRDDDAPRIIDHLLSTPQVKTAVVVDEDVDIFDQREINWAMVTRVRPDIDVIIKSGQAGLLIDPSVEELSRNEDGRSVGKTAKLGIDATKPLKESARYEKIGVPDEVQQKILKLMAAIK